MPVWLMAPSGLPHEGASKPMAAESQILGVCVPAGLPASAEVAFERALQTHGGRPGSPEATPPTGACGWSLRAVNPGLLLPPAYAMILLLTKQASVLITFLALSWCRFVTQRPAIREVCAAWVGHHCQRHPKHR